jgi:hypothetical protein
MIHVRFFYPQFDGMMRKLGRSVTDNIRWKMIAITATTARGLQFLYALTALRNIVARITYFIAGKQLDRYATYLNVSLTKTSFSATQLSPMSGFPSAAVAPLNGSEKFAP